MKYVIIGSVCGLLLILPLMLLDVFVMPQYRALEYVYGHTDEIVSSQSVTPTE